MVEIGAGDSVQEDIAAVFGEEGKAMGKVAGKVGEEGLEGEDGFILTSYALFLNQNKIFSPAGHKFTNFNKTANYSTKYEPNPTYHLWNCLERRGY